MEEEIAVIFGMDGVMVDNNDYHRIAWRDFCKKYDLNLSEDDMKENVYGRINSDILRFFFGNGEIDNLMGILQ